MVQKLGGGGGGLAAGGAGGLAAEGGVGGWGLAVGAGICSRSGIFAGGSGIFAVGFAVRDGNCMGMLYNL